jgi:phenylacetate-CoA ligase
MKLRLIQALPSFLRNLIFTIYGFSLKRNRNAYLKKYVNELEKFSMLEHTDKAKFIDDRLKTMLTHARNTVPFYKNYWDKQAQLHPELDYLKLGNWPILTKDQIRNNEGEFISKNFKMKDLIKISTSGTTGTPMKFYFDKESYSQWYTYYYYHLMFSDGLSLNSAWGNIGGRLIVNPNSTKAPFWIWNQGMHQLYLSSYHLKTENIPAYVEAIQKHKLIYLVGYPSSIHSLAKGMLSLNLKYSGLKSIYTNAEPLLDHQRITIEKAFGCKVTQTYGTSEFALSSSEDQEQKLKIWPLTGILETNLNINDTIGEFLITGMVNRAMPLIRYSIGDSGIISSENSYTYATKIDKIIGRNDDLIVSPSGKLIGRLDPIFKLDLRIKEAQIVQEKKDEIVIYVVKELGYDEKDETILLNSAKERLGEEFKLSIKEISFIERNSNGKFKSVVSKIKYAEKSSLDF